MSENQKNPLLNVTIVSPQESLFEGQAHSLTCVNKEGEFDILPYHSNFISLIYKFIIVHPVIGNPHKMEIGYALLKCIGDKITILTNVDISSYSEIVSAQHTSEAPESK